MSEIWCDIKGYEGLYRVSNLGRVKSLERLVKSKHNSNRLVKNKILMQGIDKDGYHLVVLSVNNKRATKKVARLVGMAFIPNLKNKPQINHINGIKNDNRVSNLEWCTCKENIQHAINERLRTGRRKD